MLLVGAATAHAQVEFKSLTLAKALKEAKKENKLVFLDAYTTWCGPCKFMDAEILSTAEVSAFVNERCLSVKFDMEKGEGLTIARQYNIDTYPTYLILEADGTLRNKLVGGSATPGEFLERLGAAMDPARSVGSMREQYDSGNRDIDFLLNFTTLLLDNREYDEAKTVSDALLGMLSNSEKTGANYWFIYENDKLSPFGSANFDYILMNRPAFEAGVGKEIVDARIFKVLNGKIVPMFTGSNRTASLGEAVSIAEYISQTDLPNKELLEANAAIATARLAGDSGKMLDALEKAAPMWTTDELRARYFSVAFEIRKSNIEEQRLRLRELSNKLVEASDDETFKISLGRFIELELGKEMKTGVRP